MVACDDEEFILVVQDHAEGHTLQAEKRHVSSIGVENLNAFYITNVDAAISIHGNRMGRPKLKLLSLFFAGAGT